MMIRYPIRLFRGFVVLSRVLLSLSHFLLMDGMKKILLTMTLIGLATLADAETIKIGAGGAEGEYTNTIVPTLSIGLQGYGYIAEAVISAGSQENIDKVWSGELPAGLTQLDVMALNMIEERPAFAKGHLKIIGKLSPEALFCVIKQGGKIASYDDLIDPQKAGLKVSVGPKGSGTARTFQYLMTLDPRLKSIQLIQEGNPEKQLDRLESGQRDLVCFVMMPDFKNALIKRVIKNKKLEFIGMDKRLFINATLEGESVYDVMEVPVNLGFFGWGAKRIKTLVTWIGIVVNEQWTDENFLNALSQQAIKGEILPKKSAAAKAKRLFEKNQVQMIID
jgi:TRAP-type uncharacterized transport system substrate-binding protein